MIKLLRAALFSSFFFAFGASFAQWQVVDVPNGSSVFFNRIHFTSNNIGYAIGNGGAMFKTIDRGNNWQSLSTGTNINLLGMHFTDDNNGFVVGDSALVLATTDGGQSFVRRPVPGNISRAEIAIRSVAFQPGSSAVGVFVTETGVIFRTTNGGANFLAAANTVGHSGGYSRVIFVNNTLGFAVGDRGTVAITTNGGNAWTRNASLGNVILNDVQFINANTGFIAGTGGLLRKTTNGGKTWTAMLSYVTTSINSVFFHSENFGWAVGSNGTLLKTANGRNFENQNISGETSFLSSVQFLNSNLGFAVGQGRIMRHNDFSITLNPTRTICVGNRTLVDTFALRTPEGVGFFGDNSFTLSLWTGANFRAPKTLVKEIAKIERNVSGFYTFTVDTLLSTDTVSYFVQVRSSSPQLQSTFYPVEVNLNVPARPIIGNTDSILCSLTPGFYGFAEAAKIRSYRWNFSPEAAGQLIPFGDSVRFQPNANFTGVARLSLNHFNACGISPTSAIKNLQVTAEPRPIVTGAQVICSDSTRSRYRIVNGLQAASATGASGIVSWTMNSPALGTVGPFNGFNEATIRWTAPNLSGNTGFTVLVRRRGSCRNIIDTLRYNILYQPATDVIPSVTLQALQDSVCPGSPVVVRAITQNSGRPLFTWLRDSVVVTANPIASSDPYAFQVNMPSNADSITIYTIMNSRLSCSSAPIDTADQVVVYRRRNDDPRCVLVSSSPKVALKPAIALYPNPAENEVNLVFSQFTRADISIQVFDQMGRQTEVRLNNKTIGLDKTTFTYDLSSLKPGIYLIRAGNIEHKELLRFVKK
jgi:photosystem II stability/assembly factor-like uncharacterized protein